MGINSNCFMALLHVLAKFRGQWQVRDKCLIYGWVKAIRVCFRKKERKVYVQGEKIEFIYLFNTYFLSTSYVPGLEYNGEWKKQISTLGEFMVQRGRPCKNCWVCLSKMQMLGPIHFQKSGFCSSGGRPMNLPTVNVPWISAVALGDCAGGYTTKQW